MAFPGPTPPYNNPPIEPQYYAPSRFVISDITLGVMTIITTSTNHNYFLGNQLRFIIPQEYGTIQLNGVSAFIYGIPSANQILINLNSLTFTPFIISPAYGPTPPQVMAIGDGNTGFDNANGRTNVALSIPGSFINISPN